MAKSLQSANPTSGGWIYVWTVLGVGSLCCLEQPQHCGPDSQPLRASLLLSARLIFWSYHLLLPDPQMLLLSCPLSLCWDVWPTWEVAPSPAALLSRSLPLAALFCFRQPGCHSSGTMFAFVGSYPPCQRVGSSSPPGHTQPAWSAAPSLPSPSGSPPAPFSFLLLRNNCCCKLSFYPDSPPSSAISLSPCCHDFFFNGRDWLYWFSW